MDYEELLDTFLGLPRKAQILILKCKSLKVLDDFITISPEGQSPIEKLFLVALLIFREATGFNFVIEPQYPVKCGEKKYYVDFAICHYPIFHDSLKDDFRLVIECDGYEFHQKTKEQVENDNKREYDIKLQGYDILRFSGREIYNNAIECAYKTMKYIAKKNGLEEQDDNER